MIHWIMPVIVGMLMLIAAYIQVSVSEGSLTWILRI